MCSKNIIIKELFKLIQQYLYSLKIHYFIRTKINAIISYWLHPIFNQCPTSVRFQGIPDVFGAENIEIGKNTEFRSGLYLAALPYYQKQKFSPKLIIGNNCIFGAYNNITCISQIVIGDGCLTGKWVTITDNAHGTFNLENLELMPKDRMVISKGPVIIGDNVWIGEKVTILPNVKIGSNSIIAANSVVTKDVPDNSIVAGVPASVIKRIEI